MNFNNFTYASIAFIIGAIVMMGLAYKNRHEEDSNPLNINGVSITKSVLYILLGLLFIVVSFIMSFCSRFVPSSATTGGEATPLGLIDFIAWGFFICLFGLQIIGLREKDHILLESLPYDYMLLAAFILCNLLLLLDNFGITVKY